MFYSPYTDIIKIDPRRVQELKDSLSISEDHRAIANLSNTPIHREWQYNPLYTNQYIDDGIRPIGRPVIRGK